MTSSGSQSLVGEKKDVKEKKKKSCGRPNETNDVIDINNVTSDDVIYPGKGFFPLLLLGKKSCA